MMNNNGHGAPRASSQRCLPLRDVTDRSIGDAYVAFILFCNPTIPLDTDTSDLKALFRTPPRSDGKTFDIFILFQLICKLETKEIKTWAELALELGVELPALDKGQSPQKVQQYAVRLKRWMHAMHVDAFFEYLRHKSHVYWTQVPSSNEPLPESGRDGVPSEEDLALRALLPETRPKRGRKRAEAKDQEQGGDSTTMSRKRKLNSPRVTESRKEPRPQPEDVMDAAESRELLEARLEAWAASTGNVPYDGSITHRASLPNPSRSPEVYLERRLTYPACPYPSIVSATDPFQRPYAEEANVATVETTTRPRRRNGTVVSSAWRSSSGAAEGSKLRGRPPSNRLVSHGPYSTSPAKAQTKAGNHIDIGRETSAPEQGFETWNSTPENWNNHNRGAGGDAPASPMLRPPLQDRLSGSARLTPNRSPLGIGNTPRTTELPVIPESYTRNANGTGTMMDRPQQPPVWSPYDADCSTGNGSTPVAPSAAPSSKPSVSARLTPTHPSLGMGNIQSTTELPVIPESYTRNANGTGTMTDHAQQPPVWSPYDADCSGGNGSTPTAPSAAPSHKPSEPKDTTNIEAIEMIYLQAILAAEWVDADGNLTEKCGLDEGMHLVRTFVSNLRAESADDTSFLINLAVMVGCRTLSALLRVQRLLRQDEKHDYYHCTWYMQYGDVKGHIAMECCVRKPGHDARKGEANDDGIEDPGEAELEETERDGECVDWKKKYLDLHQATVERNVKLRELKRTVLGGLFLADDRV